MYWLLCPSILLVNKMLTFFYNKILTFFYFHKILVWITEKNPKKQKPQCWANLHWENIKLIRSLLRFSECKHSCITKITTISFHLLQKSFQKKQKCRELASLWSEYLVTWGLGNWWRVKCLHQWTKYWSCPLEVKGFL